MKQRDTSVLELVLPEKGSDTHLNRQTVAGRESARSEGLTIGTLAGFDESGAPVVTVPSPGFERLLKSKSVAVLDRTAVGCSVAVQFEGADPERPVILGVIQGPLPATELETATNRIQKCVDVDMDGERLTLTADKEIVLRCGKSSITLTRAGKVLIRGAYLSSRSSGVNRIKGGSVQIN